MSKNLTDISYFQSPTPTFYVLDCRYVFPISRLSCPISASGFDGMRAARLRDIETMNIWKVYPPPSNVYGIVCR